MKQKILLLNFLLLFLHAAFLPAFSSADNGKTVNIMQINHVIATPGDLITIEVEILNHQEFVAFNLRIPLPEGFTYVEESEQLFRGTNHDFAFGVNDENLVSIIAFSITNDAFTGNDGVVFSFDVETPGEEGYYDLPLEDAVLGNSDAVDILDDALDGLVTLADPDTTYALTLIENPANAGILEGEGDYNFTDTITVTATPEEGWLFSRWIDDTGVVYEEASFDYIMPPRNASLQADFDPIENIIKIPDVTAVVDEVVTINLEIINFQEFVSFGLDILLPDGFEYQDGTAELYRKTDHVLTATSTLENTLSIAAYSPGNLEFEGNDGVIVSFDVQTSDTIGEFEFEISNPYIRDADGEDIFTRSETGIVWLRDKFELSLDVTPEDAGKAIGADDYFNGADVVIEAEPGTGWAFIKWTDEDGDIFSEEIRHEFIMPEKDLLLTANFERKKYALDLVVNPDDAGETAGEGEYYFDEEVLVEATPFTGWEFSDWSLAGDVVTTVASFTYVMPAEVVTLTANFKKTDYTLALLSNPEEGGVVSSDEYIYNYTDTVTVFAEPNEGWHFVSWEEDGVVIPDAEAEYAFTMPAANLTLTASFEKNDYNLTALAEPQEAGTVTGTGIYNMGDVAELEAAPNEGWEFINWTDDTGVVTEVASFNFVMPASHVTLTANFEKIDYTLTLVVNPEEGGEVEGGGEFNVGDEVEITAIPADGWAFVNWTDEDGEVVSETATDTIIMPADDLSLTANFEMLTFTLTFEVTDMETGETIDDAVITLNGEEFPAGHYLFENLEPGKYDYMVSREDYLPAEGSVDIIDQDVTVEVALEFDDEDISVGDIDALELTIFPNPASSIMNIESNLMINSLRLVDMLGQVVYDASIDGYKHRIPVDALHNGVYFLQVQTASGTATERIIIAN